MKAGVSRADGLRRHGGRLLFRAVWLGFALIAAVPATLAQKKPAPLEELSLEQLMRVPIVETASGLLESFASVPAAVTVLTREQIEARGDRDLAELLREVPGLTVSRTGSSGKATSLFTRGGNSTHTLMLWNGIKLNNPYFSGYDWGQFPVAGIEKIEVVRGPFSSLYGSDAMTGVVNVLTTSAPAGFWLDAQAGERGLLDGSLGGAYEAGSLRLEASAHHRQDDGWHDNDDFKQHTATAGLTWKRDQFRAGVQARYASYDLGVPFSTNAQGTRLVPSLERRQDGEELQIRIPVHQRLGRFSYDLTLSQSSREDTFADPEDPFGFTSARTESNTRRGALVARTTTGIGAILVGGEYEHAEVDDVSSFGVNLDEKTRTAKSLFLEDRYGRTIGGARLELGIGVRADDFDTFGSQVSPRVSAALLSGKRKFRASYGQGFRAPSVGELHFPFSGNTDLRPERSKTWEIGYEHFGPRARFSITWFNNEFDNLIVFDNATFHFANSGAAKTRGLEAGAWANLQSGFSAGFSYTFVDTEEAETGERLLRRPRHSGSANLAYAHGQFDAMLVLIHAGGRDDILPVLPFSRVAAEAYTTVDLTLRRDFGSVRPYLLIENMTDEKYEEVKGFPSPRRRAVVGLRYSLRPKATATASEP